MVELKFRHYSEEIDKLLAISPTLENHDTLSSAVANVWAAGGAARAVCEDLEGLLDHLIALLCVDDEDEDGRIDR